MKKSVCLLIVMALAVHSGDGIASKTTIARLLNGIHRYTEVKYADDFVKQIDKIIANKKSAGDYYDALMAGNLQEIVWHLRENGDIDAAAEMERLLTSALLGEKIVAKVRASSGITDPLILTFDNGMQGVFKTHENWEGIAMYRFDKLLGMDVFPITVRREVELNKGVVEKGSVQLFVENSISLQQVRKVYGNTLSFSLLPHPRRINTLAWLANDIDMNDNNMLIPMLGRQFAIDGGRAFHVNIGRWLAKESSDDVLKNTLDKYYTHQDFIKRLQSINATDLHHVAEPLFNVFSEDEFKILKNFEDVIASKSSKAELITAIREGALSDMATQLRKIYQTEWMDKSKAELEKLLAQRVGIYHDLLTVLDFLRQSIEDYIAAVQDI